jgi:hypothetical protein
VDALARLLLLLVVGAFVVAVINRRGRDWARAKFLGRTA